MILVEVCEEGGMDGMRNDQACSCRNSVSGLALLLWKLLLGVVRDAVLAVSLPEFGVGTWLNALLKDFSDLSDLAGDSGDDRPLRRRRCAMLMTAMAGCV
jgi:hypothetical protein